MRLCHYCQKKEEKYGCQSNTERESCNFTLLTTNQMAALWLIDNKKKACVWNGNIFYKWFHFNQKFHQVKTRTS